MTKTAMPARCASTMVADTVVAPCCFLAMTSARSRRDVLRTLGSLAILCLLWLHHYSQHDDAKTPPRELAARQADPRHPVEDGNGGRNRPRISHNLLHSRGSSEVVGIGHAVADDGRLEGDHWLAIVQCSLHLFRNAYARWRLRRN